jgi:hypothetical protein
MPLISPVDPQPRDTSGIVVTPPPRCTKGCEDGRRITGG